MPLAGHKVLLLRRRQHHPAQALLPLLQQILGRGARNPGALLCSSPHRRPLRASPCAASAHHMKIRGDVRLPKRRRREKPSAERPRLPCPRCGSSDTRFLKYLSKGRTRPQHFCFSCERCWLGGAALQGWRWRAAAAPAAARPPCPWCRSPCTRSSGYCDAGRTKQRHSCLRCNKSWIGEVDGWTSTEVNIIPDDVPPAMESSFSSSSASQPAVAEASPCWTSGNAPTETAAGVAVQDATVLDTCVCPTMAAAGSATETAAGRAAQDATVLGTRACPTTAAASSAEQEPAVDLAGNTREEREMSWEDIEWIDYALECHLREDFMAAFFPTGEQ